MKDIDQLTSPLDEKVAAKENLKWLIYASVVVVASAIFGQFPAIYNLIAQVLHWAKIANTTDATFLATLFGAEFTLVVIMTVSNRGMVSKMVVGLNKRMVGVIREELGHHLDASVVNMVVQTAKQDPEIAAKYLHLIQQHCDEVSKISSPRLQAAALILATEHLTNWKEDMRKLTSSGIPMLSTVRLNMTKIIVDKTRKYTLIEPFISNVRINNTDDWNNYYREMGDVEKEWVVCVKAADLKPKDIDVLKNSAKYMKDCNFTVWFCDPSRFPPELMQILNEGKVMEYFGDNIIKTLKLPPGNNYSEGEMYPTIFRELPDNDLYVSFIREIRANRVDALRLPRLAK